MRWVNVIDELPTDLSKKYIVETETKNKHHNVLRVDIHFDEHKKAIWGCKNQIVVKWLDEL